jgi:hypothetical protein
MRSCEVNSTVGFAGNLDTQKVTDVAFNGEFKPAFFMSSTIWSKVLARQTSKNGESSVYKT